MSSSDEIATSAEALEGAAIPQLREVHTDPNQDCASKGDIPEALKKPTKNKSPAQWAYERIVLYIQNFEKIWHQRRGPKGATGAARQPVERDACGQPQEH